MTAGENVETYSAYLIGHIAKNSNSYINIDTAINVALKKLSKKLGFTVSAHILRHTYATRLEEAGISPKIQQYLLGHATVDITQNVYTDAQSDYINSVSDRIRAIFDTK